MQRTRGSLHRALAALLHEKAYDDIVVKEILARANVGRSTFYAHFPDKDALLASGIADMLRADGAGAPPRAAGPDARAERLLRFGLPVFAHIERHRRGRDAMPDPRHHAVPHRRLRQAVAAHVADELRRTRPGAGANPDPIPPDLLAEYVASVFVTVLQWWLTRPELPPAARADATFRALALPSLAAALGR